MTDLLHDVDAPSDAELISRVRGGDVAAYGDLFARHVDAAKRLARQLVRGPDADDLVSDAFAKVLSVLQGGGGPDVAFRAYLLTAVRRLHVDKLRSGARLQTSDDMEAFDAGVPFQDTAVAAFESGAAAKAFASLPERWQLVLWHLEVEGQKPADIAPLLGMSPNSVSALAYRAREGLRQAFLTMHLNDISETDCRWVNEHLGAYVRNGLAKRDSVKVRAHLDECRRCTAMYLELTEVNSNLAAIIAPLLLGAAATGYLASAGGAAGGMGISAVFGRIRDVVSANAGVATAGAVAAGVAAVATAGIMLLPSSSDPDAVVGADRPVQTVSTPPAEAGGNDKPGDKQGRKPSADETAAGGPAVLVPSELPSPTDTPAAVVALDPGTTTAGDGTTTTGGTTGTTGGGTTPGGTANPPGDQTSTPTQPAPTEPAPTETTAPPPTETTAPPPTETTAPPPTETTAPPPTETTAPPPPPPTDPPPVTYTLTAGPATISNDQVSFDVTGTPELPPTVYLKIDSDPAGIVFSGDGTCKVRAGDTTVAVCDTTPATAVASLARTLLATSSTGFPVTMPLGGSPTRTTDVTITLSAPEDTVLQTVRTKYVVDAPPTTADVSLSDLPAQVQTDSVHDYAFSGTVAGIPVGYTGGASFTLTSSEDRARFVSSNGCTVAEDGQTLTCATIADGDFPFLVHVKDNSVDTDITITLGALDRLTDDVLTNNVAKTVLKALRPADVKLSLTTQVIGNAGRGTATALVSDAPAEGATLTAAFDPLGITFTTQPDGCVAGDGTVTCTGVQDGSSLTFEAELKDRPANFSTETITFTASVPEGYVDPDLTNNTAEPMVIPREKGTTGTSSELRTAASDGSSAGADVVDHGAGSAPTTSPTLRKTASKVNLLSETRQQPSGKADAPVKKQAQDPVKADKGKHRAVGHDKTTPASTKKDQPGAQKSDKPTKADKGNDAGKGKGSDKPSQGQTPGQSEQPGGTSGTGNGNGGNGNGGNGNDQSPGKKDEPGPVARVISAAADLLL